MWKRFKLWLVRDELAVYEEKSQADTALLNNSRGFRDKAEAELKELRFKKDELDVWAGRLGAQIQGLEKQAQATQKAHLEQIAKIVGQVDLVKGLEIHPQTVSMGLAGVTEQTAWWKALHSILNQEIMLARDASVQPNLSSETRHYNAGRCAGLVDLQATLLGAWAREQKPGEGV